MSIIDTFDNETEAMIHLEDVCQKVLFNWMFVSSIFLIK